MEDVLAYDKDKFGTCMTTRLQNGWRSLFAMLCLCAIVLLCHMPHQKFEGERTLMRIHIGESVKWYGKPLHEAIVEMLRKEGFSGGKVSPAPRFFAASRVTAVRASTTPTKSFVFPRICLLFSKSLNPPSA